MPMRLFFVWRRVFFAIVAASLVFPCGLFCAAQAAVAPSSDASTDSNWIRPQHAGDPLIWGRKDGIVFGLPSPGGLPGPRGLIRVGMISEKTGKPQLLNFIAIEPVVMGPGDRYSRMAFSELEASQMDAGSHGKRLWVDDGDARGKLVATLEEDTTIESLSVPIAVERFSANGAHVYVVASIDSDHPDELRLSVHARKDSPALDDLTVTATMGNYERLRQVYLKDRTVFSGALYGSYRGDDFMEHESYPLEEMLRNTDGDAIVLATSNEASPASAPSTSAPHWHYDFSRRLTQYWRVPAHDLQPDLRVRVNGRRVYWQSHDPLPGGIAFENFEVRQRYVDGQTFIFGVTPKEPWEFDPPIPHLKRP